MCRDLLSGELKCFMPAFVGFDSTSLFGSNPNYDEAHGPCRDDCFVPIDEVCEEQGDGCLVVRQCEPEEEQQRRWFWVDPDEPLGYGETLNMVRAEYKALTEARIRASIDEYAPPRERARVAIRLFSKNELLSARPGVVTATIKKFDSHVKRFVRVQCTVVVLVRRAKRQYEKMALC